MMTCKLCGKSKQLIKAHSIPECFFRLLRNGKTPPKLVSNTPDTYPKKSPIGVYDKQILCGDCEHIFSPLDDYACKLLIETFSEKFAITYNGKTIGYKLDKIDYNKLKLFFMSVLWRAAASTHTFYSRVTTGPYEEQLREMIISGDPGTPELFSVILARFNSPFDKVTDTISDPFRTRFDGGVNYYVFYMGSFIAYIKIDKRPTPSNFARVQLTPNEPLIILTRDFLNSRELKIIKKVVASSKIKLNK
jgi:hypothetical protein